MMIIYHFKQRITVIEKKTETTIDILNNLAKEIGSLRNAVTIIVREQSRQERQSPGSVEQFFFSQGGSPFNTLSSKIIYNHNDEDDNDEFPGSGIQREVNNITIDLNEENVEIDHLEIGGTETENTNKIILLDNNEIEDDSDEDDDDEDSDEDSYEDSDSEDDEDSDLSNSVIVSASEEPVMTIEKIVVSDSEPEPLDITPVRQSDPEPPALDYSKLTTSQLKNIVLDKKLYDGNVNKLKRSELLKRLQ